MPRNRIVMVASTNAGTKSSRHRPGFVALTSMMWSVERVRRVVRRPAGSEVTDWPFA